MKKASLVIFAALLASAAAFAEPAATAMQPFMGKIKSIVPATTPMGHSDLILVDNTGKEVRLMLSSKTKISDKTGKAAPLSRLAAGENVKVSAAGTKAASIEIED